MAEDKNKLKNEEQLQEENLEQATGGHLFFLHRSNLDNH